MKRILEFEGLRGLLAWWVVVSHVVFMSGIDHGMLPGPLRYLRLGSLAVDVFIILSGYVIMNLIHNEPMCYRRYLWRRFLRIYPALVVCLLLSLFTFGVLVEIL